MLRFVLLILAGLLSVPLMEVGSFIWMRIMPPDMDLTANYFLMVVLPIALILHFLMALVFWKAFEPQPKTAGATYLITHVAGQMTLLTLVGNPLKDVLTYALMLMISGIVVLFVFNRYFWCPRCVAA